MIFYTIVCVILQWCHNVEGNVSSTIYTLAGDCPDVKLQENLDYTRFSGNWYNIMSYASDGRIINDCATLEFQEDNLGYTLRETFVEPDKKLGGNRTQKTYFARVDPTFDAGNKAKFVISYESGDNVHQYPFVILSTDYDNYAITYTCKNMGRKVKMHYVFVWVLTRSKEIIGPNLEKFELALSKYPELLKHRNDFDCRDFSEASCAFNIKQDSFSSNFW